MGEENKIISSINFPKGNPTIIKVIGVGGGGGNAVNHMYNEGINDVSFVVCNTDNKALEDSPVPTKLQLGEEGLGAGNKPEVAREATIRSIDEVKKMLNDGTKMVFITAGMGGGTGTGAAPIIANAAKEMGILTVGIVTIPFLWEGKKKINQALDGVEEISKNVDALLVINNERLRTIYSDSTLINAFAKADDTLCNAAKSIADIINMRGIINLDFRDVNTVLRDGGVAIMSTGFGKGENRLTAAINDALNSPLLNDNDVYNAKKILISISFNGGDENELMMDEINEVHEFMAKLRDENVETKWGLSSDNSLGDQVKVTILASGFGVADVADREEYNKLLMQKESKISNEESEEQEIRRNRYYGPDSGKPTVKRYRIYIFENDNMLDNNEVINAVLAKPTCKREKEDLNAIIEKSSVLEKTIDPSAGNASVINF